MYASRRLLPVLATATLAVCAAPARAQSGAGDDQYTDPFGSTTKKAPARTTPAKTTTTARSSAKTQSGPPLSNQPPVSPTQTSPPPSTTTNQTTTPVATAQLP